MAATKGPAMGRLPAELLNAIVDDLSVEDVRSLYVATSRIRAYSQVAACSISRISVNDYLDANLGDSRIILESMSRNFVYISGSRALEFFKKGCANNESDWDFYIPNHAHLVHAFMHDMERVGVTWRSPMNELRKLMREHGGRVRVHRATFVDFIESVAFFQEASKLGFEIRGVPTSTGETFDADDLPPFHSVEINKKDKSIILCSGEKYEDYDDITCIKRVVRGELRRGTGKVEIQLMVEEREHLFDTTSIFKFHSSAVQCYLSAHIACHYYGKDAWQGITHVWYHFIDDNPKGTKALQKYRDRGFREEDVTPAKRGFEVRMGDGDQASFLGGYNYTGASDSLVQNLVRHARTTTWLEKPGKTKLKRIAAFPQPWLTKHYLEASGAASGKYPPHPIAQQWAV